MKIKKLTARMFIACFIITLTSLVIGCGGSSSDDSDNNTNNNSNNDNTNNQDDNTDVEANEFAGTWLIQKEDTTSFWIFNTDGTFEKKRAGEPINVLLHL